MDIKADIQAGKFPQLHDNNTVVIGAGTSETDKKNGFETTEDGKAYLLGVGDYDGTNPATSKDLATVINERGELDPASADKLGGIKLFVDGVQGYAICCTGSSAYDYKYGIVITKEAPDGYGPYGQCQRVYWVNRPTLLKYYPEKKCNIVPFTTYSGSGFSFDLLSEDGSSYLYPDNRYRTDNIVTSGLYEVSLTSSPFGYATTKPLHGQLSGTDVCYWDTRPVFIGRSASIYAVEVTLDSGDSGFILSSGSTTPPYNPVTCSDTPVVTYKAEQSGIVRLDEENRAFVDISGITPPPASTTDFGGIKLYEESTAPTGAVKLDGAGRAYVTMSGGGDCNLEKYSSEYDNPGYGTAGSRSSTYEGDIGEHSITFGYHNSASGDCDFAGGAESKALDGYSFAFGYSAYAKENSIALGDNARAVSSSIALLGRATGNASIAIGGEATNAGIAIGGHALGTHSVAIGLNTTTRNQFEVARGGANRSLKLSDGTDYTIDTVGGWSTSGSGYNILEQWWSGKIFIMDIGGFNGTNSVTSGTTNVQFNPDVKDLATVLKDGANLHQYSGTNSNGSGWGTDGSRLSGSSVGTNSITFGTDNIASGGDSVALGSNTKATNAYEFAQGRFNFSHAATISSIGIGTSDTARKNAFEVLSDGRMYVLGVGDYDGTNPAMAQDLAAAIAANCNLEKYESSSGSVGWGTADSRGSSGSTGDYSITFGEGCTASGRDSYAEGSGSAAIGECAHAEGFSTASKDYSHAECNSTASGEYAHSEGSGSEASGKYAHSEGQYTVASGECSHAEGVYSTASGEDSHAEGSDTTAEGVYAHAEGSETKALEEASHAEGYFSEASGKYAHAECWYTAAHGIGSHAEGISTITTNQGEHAEGMYNVSHAWEDGIGGTRSSVGIGSGDFDRRNAIEVFDTGQFFVNGIGNYDGTNAGQTGVKDLASAMNTVGNLQAYTPGLTSDGKNAVTGYGTDTSRMENSTIGDASVTFGKYNTASNYCSAAFGNSTLATGEHSFAEGSGSRAEGSMSHAEGWGARACGRGSHAEGQSTETTNECEHAQGRFNMSHAHTIDSVGIGDNTDDRRNATEVMDDGKMYVLGIGNYNGRNTGASGVKDLASEFHWLQTRIAELEAKLGGK